MAKFAFLIRDWKEQLSSEELNKVLSSINEPVRAFDLDTLGDDYCLVIHTPDIKLTSEEWRVVLEGNRILAEPELPDHAPRDAAYLETSVEEVKDFIKKVKEAERQEVDEEIARILRLKVRVLNGETGIISVADTYTKERIWEAIKADPSIDQMPVSKLREIAKQCGKDLAQIW